MRFFKLEYTSKNLSYKSNTSVSQHSAIKLKFHPYFTLVKRVPSSTWF